MYILAKPGCYDRIRWAANPGRSQGATAEKANAVPERCPSILFSILTVVRVRPVRPDFDMFNIEQIQSNHGR